MRSGGSFKRGGSEPASINVPKIGPDTPTGDLTTINVPIVVDAAPPDPETDSRSTRHKLAKAGFFNSAAPGTSEE